VWWRVTAGNRPIVALNSKGGIGYTHTHYGPWGDTTRLYFDHSGGSNYLMCDGHVEWFKNEEMYGYWQLPFGDKPSKKRWWINQ